MAKSPAVSLAPGIWRIPLLGDWINGFIFRDPDGQVTLLDMGLPTSGRKVLDALTWIGSAPADVTRLLLTHAHSDHAGGAARVARETDGQVLEVAGGLRVVHTPGHSPGHASYLHEDTGVLITGDALFNVRRVRWPVKAFCTDFAMTKRTAHVLGELDYRIAAFTHGPELRDHPRQDIRAFLSRSA